MCHSVFVIILQVGLCHVSELSDTHIDKIADKYKAGERVVAKILKVCIIVFPLYVSIHCVIISSHFLIASILSIIK